MAPRPAVGHDHRQAPDLIDAFVALAEEVCGAAGDDDLDLVAPLDELVEDHRQQARESLLKVAGELLADREVDCEVRRGVDHQQIVELAREREVDLIVLGMHGHGFQHSDTAGMKAFADNCLHQDSPAKPSSLLMASR